MQRLTGAVLTASLILGGILPAGATTIGASSGLRGPVLHRNELTAASGGWVSTATKAMLPSNALDLGAVPAAMPMKIVVGLQANKSGAEALARHMYTPGDPLYHHFMTPSQYSANFAPSSASVSAVESYLSSLGFTNIAASPNNLVVRAQGNAALVNRAFNTTIEGFSQAGKSLFVNSTPAMVPAALSGIVLGVLGLQNSPMQIALRHPRHPAMAVSAMRRARALSRNRLATTAANPCELPVSGLPCAPSSFYSNDFRTFYDAAPADTGANTNEAVFTEGDVSDIVPGLKQNWAYNSLPSFPVNIVKVDLQSTDTFAQGEFTMDTQMSTGLAYTVKSLTLYNTGSLDDADITLSLDRWVSDDFATVANASFGECEYEAELDGAMPLDDQILQEGLLQGQTLFASSGDSSSSCGFNIVTNGFGPLGPPQVEYPATSPYAMGAGGTTALPNGSDGSYDGEIPWYSGGGGISLFEPPEFWTYPAVAFQCIPVYCSIAGPGLPVAVTGGMARAVPDVAMDADAEDSGANYFLNGSQTENGGTSLAAPLSTGSYVILQSHNHNTLGAAGPTLYPVYVADGGGTAKATVPPAGQITVPIAGFHDILIGSNGAYTALPGYDLTTGMGSFDIQASIASLGG